MQMIDDFVMHTTTPEVLRAVRRCGSGMSNKEMVVNTTQLAILLSSIQKIIEDTLNNIKVT